MYCSRKARAAPFRNRRSRAMGLIPPAGHRNMALASRNCGRFAEDDFRPGLVQHTFGWPLSGGAAEDLFFITTMIGWCQSDSSSI